MKVELSGWWLQKKKREKKYQGLWTKHFNDKIKISISSPIHCWAMKKKTKEREEFIASTSVHTRMLGLFSMLLLSSHSPPCRIPLLFWSKKFILYFYYWYHLWLSSHSFIALHIGLPMCKQINAVSIIILFRVEIVWMKSIIAKFMKLWWLFSRCCVSSFLTFMYVWLQAYWKCF